MTTGGKASLAGVEFDRIPCTACQGTGKVDLTNPVCTWCNGRGWSYGANCPVAPPDPDHKCLADAVADHLTDPDYQGFVRTFRKMGAEVSEVRYDADGMAEILLAWPEGWQIVSRRQAIREQ